MHCDKKTARTQGKGTLMTTSKYTMPTQGVADSWAQSQLPKRLSVVQDKQRE